MKTVPAASEEEVAAAAGRERKPSQPEGETECNDFKLSLRGGPNVGFRLSEYHITSFLETVFTQPRALAFA